MDRHIDRATFIPKGAIKITPKDLDAVVYIYERNGQPIAIAFSGKRGKPDFHIRYRTPQRMEEAVRQYLDRLKGTQVYKQEQRAKRKGFRHSYNVGDVLHYSWGYEQTNCEFYQVIATTPGTVTIREIAQENEPDSTLAHGMADMRVAVKDSFLTNSGPMVKRVQYSDSGPGYISMAHGCCSLWDGRSRYCSWYA